MKHHAAEFPWLSVTQWQFWRQVRRAGAVWVPGWCCDLCDRGEVPAGGAAVPVPGSCGGRQPRPTRRSRRVPGSPVDVRVADVALVGLFQVGRARRLHVVTDRPELELAEVQRCLLRGVQLPADGCAATLRALSTWRSASCTARRMVMFSARICPSLMNPSPLPGLSGSNAQRPWKACSAFRTDCPTTQVRSCWSPGLRPARPMRASRAAAVMMRSFLRVRSLGVLSCPSAAWRGTPPGTGDPPGRSRAHSRCRPEGIAPECASQIMRDEADRCLERNCRQTAYLLQET